MESSLRKRKLSISSDAAVASSICSSSSSISILNDAFIHFTQTSDEKGSSSEGTISNPLKKKKKIEHLVDISSCDKKLGYSKNLNIPITGILYNRCFAEGLSCNHYLNKKFASDKVSTMLKFITNIDSGIPDPPVDINTLKLLPKLLDILEQIPRKWEKIFKKRCLETNCPSRLKENNASTRTLASVDFGQLSSQPSISPLTLRTLLEEGGSIEPEAEKVLVAQELSYEVKSIGDGSPFWCCQPISCVWNFLTSLIDYSIPMELFGSKRNSNSFKNSLMFWLKMGRHDTFHLDCLMLNVSIGDCKWLLPLSSFKLRTKVASMIWIWLFQFCMTLIKAYFYVTESCNKKNQLFYFRKRDWQHFHFKEYNKCLSEKKLRVLSQNEAFYYASHLHKTLNSLRTSHIPAMLRFVPKLSGLRPILPIRDAGVKPFLIFKAKLLIHRVSSKFYEGSDSKSFKVFHNTYQKFFQNIKGFPSAKLFVVRADISDAYGSIKLNTLLSLLKNGINQLPKYILFGRYSLLSSTKETRKIHYIPLDERGHPLEPLFVNQCPLVAVNEPLRIDTNYTYQVIKCLLKQQIVRGGSYKRLLIMKGIAQGARLSSALCEMYYAAMCRKYLLHYNTDKTLFVRFVDDFLLLTIEKSTGQDFLKTLQKGFPKFNCFMNNSKTFHNLDNERPIRIPYRGMIYCTASRQFLVSGVSLISCLPRYSLQFNNFKNQGQFLSKKLGQIVKARLCLLMYHPSTVSEDALMANVWRISLSIGGRFQSMVDILFPKKSINEKFLVNTLNEVAIRIYSRIKKVWINSDNELSFSQHYFVVLFLGGIFCTIGLPKFLPLPGVRKIIRSIIIKKIHLFSLHEKGSLPSPLKKFLKVPK